MLLELALLEARQDREKLKRFYRGSEWARVREAAWAMVCEAARGGLNPRDSHARYRDAYFRKDRDQLTAIVAEESARVEMAREWYQARKRA
jgi:hypothetical protein